MIIVTPLAKSDLHSLTANKVLRESNCRRLCRQILTGLQYLHSQGLVHGDIKPENVLIFDSKSVIGKYAIQICDFGFAEKIGETGLLPYRGMRGSYGYFSPEQLNCRPYGQAVDIFALGIIIYSLLVGYEPFYPTNRAGLLTGDPDNDSTILRFDSPYWDRISVEAKAFLIKTLHGDPKGRFTAADALRSEWLNIDVDPTIEEDTADVEDASIQFE